MSAFEGKADMTFAMQMSPFDPKRTSVRKCAEPDRDYGPTLKRPTFDIPGGRRKSATGQRPMHGRPSPLDLAQRMRVRLQSVVGLFKGAQMSLSGLKSQNFIATAILVSTVTLCSDAEAAPQ